MLYSKKTIHSMQSIYGCGDTTRKLPRSLETANSNILCLIRADIDRKN